MAGEPCAGCGRVEVSEVHASDQTLAFRAVKTKTSTTRSTISFGIYHGAVPMRHGSTGGGDSEPGPLSFGCTRKGGTLPAYPLAQAESRSTHFHGTGALRCLLHRTLKRQAF